MGKIPSKITGRQGEPHIGQPRDSYTRLVSGYLAAEKKKGVDELTSDDYQEFNNQVMACGDDDLLDIEDFEKFTDLAEDNLKEKEKSLCEAYKDYGRALRDSALINSLSGKALYEGRKLVSTLATNNISDAKQNLKNTEQEKIKLEKEVAVLEAKYQVIAYITFAAGNSAHNYHCGCDVDELITNYKKALSPSAKNH